ncbi:MAG: TylF/MycF/NovP-related O-methyltransferase [Patescibacteria group bacterium]
MIQKTKLFLLMIGASSNPLAQIITQFLRFPIKVMQMQLLNIRKDNNLIGLIHKVQKDKGFMMWPDELVFIYHCALSMTKLSGDFAEVGVCKGASAKVICEAKGGKFLHLFDTFEGLPKPGAFDGMLQKKQYLAPLKIAKAYLKKYKNVVFYKGFFPGTSRAILGGKFAFVHLDVDLYQSTLDCLKIFYPRMEKGGIILSHDYSTLNGVRKAFEEYFADKQELVLELPTSQCMIIKL